jgi:hypothetical protein
MDLLNFEYKCNMVFHNIRNHSPQQHSSHRRDMNPQQQQS